MCKFKYGQNEELDNAAKSSLSIISDLLNENKIPRGDYKELAELVQFYLSPEIHMLRIRQPGAVHHARFMAQSKYYMKLQILSQTTDIASTAEARQEIEAISEFVALYYAKWFLTSLRTISSPRQDLQAILEMKFYKQYRPDVTSKCLKSMVNHSWYLHSSVIPISLLDPEVPDRIKAEIAQKILEVKYTGKDDLKYKKANISFLIEDSIEKPNLSQFVTNSSKSIFDVLGMEENQLEWMQLPPQYWHKLSSFNKFQSLVEELPVTNDYAERNVALVQDFFDTFHEENMKQDLLLAIEKKRKGGRPAASNAKKRKD